MIMAAARLLCTAMVQYIRKLGGFSAIPSLPSSRLCGSGSVPHLTHLTYLTLVAVLGLTLSASAQNIQSQRLLSLGPPGLAGRHPYVGVIQADNGALYGTASQGGA